MSRVINPNLPGRERQQFLKAINSALIEWYGKSIKDEKEYWDLAAFITLLLDAISSTVEITVSAWEKRGYWLKAEKFMKEWSWTGILAARLRTNIVRKQRNMLEKDIAQVDSAVKGVVKTSSKPLQGKPWEGAYQKIMKNNGHKD